MLPCCCFFVSIASEDRSKLQIAIGLPIRAPAESDLAGCDYQHVAVLLLLSFPVWSSLQTRLFNSRVEFFASHYSLGCARRSTAYSKLHPILCVVTSASGSDRAPYQQVVVSCSSSAGTCKNSIVFFVLVLKYVLYDSNIYLCNLNDFFEILLILITFK